MLKDGRTTRRIALAALVSAALVPVLAAVPHAAWAGEDAVVIPAPAVDEKPGSGLETAVVAGGCFWGVQGVFQHVQGVTDAVSGYAGGDKATAQYETVSGGDTGHAESVRITYDPRKITYGQLLQIYFSVAHDPTELNRQGPDSGTQYRSAIFPQNAGQADIARAYIAQLDKAGVFGGRIVTKTDPAKGFYPAEGYHQNFLAQNPAYPYIVINDLPKVENLKRLFPSRYRDTPVLTSAASG